MERTTTERGFGRFDAIDINGDRYSLQESSLATEDAVWLGCDDFTAFDADRLGTVLRERTPAGDIVVPPGVRAVKVLGRMHLSREMVAEMLPALAHFVETGRLP
jgi:hypothetical protein